MSLISDGLHRIAGWIEGTAPVSSETKADSGTFNTPADAFASTMGSGGNFNQNFSSFNNQKQQLQSYVEWVYVGVSAIAEHCAAIDLRLFQNHTKIKNAAIGEKLIYHPRIALKLQQRHVSFIEQKGGRMVLRKDVSALEELEDHPLLDLLHNPNPYMVKNEFFETTFLHMMLTGDAFWVIFRDKKGQPAELWPLMPDRVTVVPDKTHFVVGYLYQVDGNQIPFSPDDIIHHKFSHPADFHRGYSPIMAGARTIDTDSHASNWNRMTLYNGVGPGGVFQTDAKLDEIVYKRLKSEIMDTYGGTSNHGKPIITEQGLKFTPGSMGTKDMDFINSRNFNRDQILAILGVPRSVVGLDESMSRANAETAEYVFSKRNRNKMQRLVNRITEDLAIQFTENLVVSFTDPVPEDKEFVLQETETALANAPYAMINEERAKRGDDPVEGGDEIWIQSTMVPLSAALEKAKNPQPSPIPAVNPSDEDEDMNGNSDDGDDNADDGSGDNSDTSGQNDENDSSGNTDNSGDTSGSSSSEQTNDSGNQASVSGQITKGLKTVVASELPSVFKQIKAVKKLPDFPRPGVMVKIDSLPDFPSPIPEPDEKPTDPDDPMNDPENVELPSFPPSLPDQPVMSTPQKTVTKDADTGDTLKPNEALQKFFDNQEQLAFGFEKRMLRGAQEIFLLQKHEVLSNLPALIAVKGEGKAKVKAAKKSKLNSLFDKTESAAKWVGMLAPAYAHLSMKAGDAAMAVANDPVKYGYAVPSDAADAIKAAPQSYDSATPAIKQYFGERAGSRNNNGTVTNLPDSVGKLIDDETDKQLRATLAEGLSSGASLQDMADSVESVYGAASGYRALRIARTESQAALQFSQQQAWEQTGLVKSYVWQVDGDPCPICVGLSQLTARPINQFPNGGSDPHPNCRCPGCVPASFDVSSIIAPLIGAGTSE